MEPLISVIIPVHEVLAYLPRCIESVMQQSYENLEIIIVDDGSTDGSERLCEEMQNRDPRIKVVHQEYMGVSGARNTGLREAKGEYLAFVDSDDWVDVNYLNTLWRICEQTGCRIAQCGFRETLDELENQENHQWKNNGIYVYSAKEFCSLEYIVSLRGCTTLWNKLFHRSLFDGIEFPTGKIHEDEFVTYRVIWKSEKIAVTNVKLYYYRRREGSIMTSEYSINRLDLRIAYEERYRFYCETGETELALLTRKRHLQWAEYQLEFLEKLNEKNLLLEMKETIKKLRVELADKNVSVCCDEMEERYVFPFEEVEKGTNIILYGAGNIGKLFYRQIAALDYCYIRAWVDMDAMRLRKQGLPVDDVKTILHYGKDIDKIIIAVKNRKAVKDIIKLLCEKYNADVNKIVHEIIPI